MTKLYITPTRSLKDNRKSEALISPKELASTRRYGDLRPDGVRRIADSISGGKNVAQALEPLGLRVQSEILKILSTHDAVQEFLDAEKKIRKGRKARKESRARYIENLSKPIQETPAQATNENLVGQRSVRDRIYFEAIGEQFTTETQNSFTLGKEYDITIPNKSTRTLTLIRSNSHQLIFQDTNNCRYIYICPNEHDVLNCYAVPHQE